MRKTLLLLPLVALVLAGGYLALFQRDMVAGWFRREKPQQPQKEENTLLADAPVVSVRLKSLDGLRSDAVFLLSQVFPPDQAKQQVDQSIQGALPGGIPPWLDTTRPFGLSLAGIPTTAADAVKPLLLSIPVREEKDVLAWLENLGRTPSKGADGTYTLEIPKGPTLMLRFANGYAWLSGSRQLLRGKWITPKAGEQQSALAIGLHPNRLTKSNREALYKLWGGLVDAALYGPSAQGDAEPDAEYQTRVGNKKRAREMLALVVEGFDEITFNLGVERKQGLMALDLGFTPRAGTALDRLFQPLPSLRSKFSHLAEDGLVRVYACGPYLRDWDKVFGQTLPQLRDRVLREVTDVKEQALVRKLFQILKPNLAATGMLDFGLAFRRPVPGQPYVVVGGVRFKGAPKLERLLRDELKDAPADIRGQIKWNHAQHGPDKIHLIPIQDKELAAVLGKPDLYFAFQEEAVVFALGKEGLTAIKKALDDLARPPAPVHLHLEADVVQLVALALKTTGQQAALADLLKLFPNPDRQRLPVIVSASWGRPTRLRYAFPVEMLRLIRLAPGFPRH